MVKKLLLIFLIIFISLVAFTSKVHAVILFEDDFEDGNADGWTPVLGPNLWQVKDVNGSKMYGARIETGSTLIDSVAATVNTGSYQIEFDYLPVVGVDRNLDFRWINNNPYEVHFLNENPVWTNFGYPNFTSPVPLSTNQLHYIRIILQNQHIQFFLDGIKIIDYVHPTYVFSPIEKVGARVGTGASFPTEVWFDNVVVSTIDEEVDLSVPPLKQTDPSWGDQIYNSANIWAPSSLGISSWGCALTSAAMVFRYHGITKMPDGSDLNPGTLNDWLKSQPGGYVNNGWVHWGVLARLSKLAESNNPGFLFDSLEYRRTNGEDKTQLMADLQNGIPGILEEPGHFVVGRGTSGDTFLINDPFYNRPTLNDGYSNTFLSLGRYVPSSSDLSYITLIVDENVNISLTDSDGNSVGEVFMQQPLLNDSNGIDENGPPLRMLYFPKPDSGEYNLNLSSSSESIYTLYLHLFDKEGDYQFETINGVVGSSDSDSLSINFDRENHENSSSESVITFDSLILDINSLYELGEIDNGGVYNSLLVKANGALLSSGINTKLSKNILKALLNELRAQRGKHISENAFIILSSDIQTLLSSI